jgi:protein-disulfide isomerase
MGKMFWAILAAIALLFVGLIAFTGEDKKSPAGGNASKATNHVSGSASTGVKLVEYGDFECQFCGQYYPIVEQVKDKYKDKIQFQFRNLPLIQIHKNAFVAARSAEAADKQGKYWDMYNLLFANQTSWSEAEDAKPIFEQYATQLGLNVEKFKADVTSTEVNDIINADIAEFKKTGEKMSTPTFFLDGKKIEPKSVDEFSKLIDEAIKNKEKK